MRVLAALVLLSGCPGVLPTSCTEIGCTDGFTVDFALTAPGAYVITATTVPPSGTVTCEVTLPLSDTGGCTGPGYITQYGSALPADQQSIGGLLLTSTDLDSIALVITLDGAPIFDETLTPTYEELQPNGPGCEPTCRYGGFEVTVE